jgi:outer membrane protein OmpA-like peptidoglycan-associated protein
MRKLAIDIAQAKTGPRRTGFYVGALWASSLAVLGAHAQTAPAAPPVEASIPHSYLVFFDFDKADLTPEALKVVDQAAANAAAGKVTKIEATGYTDTVGSEAYNMRLSRRRALAVSSELEKQGVPADEIAIFAKGKHDLLVPTADGVKEPQNRRVQIVYAAMAPAEAPPAPAPEAAAAPPAPPEFAVWGQLEAGVTGNPDSPRSGLNYGHLFTDKSNQLVLNQILVTAEKPLDTNATDYALGYRVQGMFGTDARYTHFLGELDLDIKERTQLDVVEAWAYVHTPWLTDGGIDFKIGQYVTYLGSEYIDPSLNYFYSKSYIFNFGIPLKHTGIMAITHVNPTLDIYTGVDTGVNTSAGDNEGDNNSSFAFQGGFGLNNLLGGKLTVVALTHFGPENPRNNHDMRWLNDVVLTYKATDVWTFVTELNYAKDDSFGPADAYGIAQYASYALNDQMSLNGRIEFFRDNSGFFAGAFQGNRTFVQFERGLPLDGAVFGPGSDSYGELTLGVTYKPPVPAPLQSLMIRPEVRVDDSLNGKKAYDLDGTGVGHSDHQVTLGLDFVIRI